MANETDKIGTDEIKEIMEKYKEKVSTQLGVPMEEVKSKSGKPVTMEYTQFKKEMLPGHMSLYEKGCNLAESIIKMTPKKEKAAALQESIDISHLNITPTGASSFAMLIPMMVMFLGIIQYVVTGALFFTVFLSPNL